MGVINVKIKVYGRVQGVCFRALTKKSAITLGINGWVRNLSDGTVEIECESTLDKIEQLISILKVGNGFSRVDKFYKTEGVFVGYQSFKIVY
ncbi:MAG: acylphosphatase [Spirochaetaceae bacterium]